MAIVAFIVYRILLLIKGTRAMQMLTGLGILGIGFFLSSLLSKSGAGPSRRRCCIVALQPLRRCDADHVSCDSSGMIASAHHLWMHGPFLFD